MFEIPGNPQTDTPFVEMHVWKWMEQQPRANVNTKNYLASIGFVSGRDTLTEDQGSILRHAVEHFRDTAPHMGPTVFDFEELFTPHTDDTNGPGYWVNGKPGRYDPKPIVYNALVAAGWVYHINPDTTYFEIVNKKKIVAKYQRILGSRPLAHIKEM